MPALLATSFTWAKTALVAATVFLAKALHGMNLLKKFPVVVTLLKYLIYQPFIPFICRTMKVRNH